MAIGKNTLNGLETGANISGVSVDSMIFSEQLQVGQLFFNAPNLGITPTQRISAVVGSITIMDEEGNPISQVLYPTISTGNEVIIPNSTEGQIVLIQYFYM